VRNKIEVTLFSAGQQIRVSVGSMLRDDVDIDIEVMARYVVFIFQRHYPDYIPFDGSIPSEVVISIYLDEDNPLMINGVSCSIGAVSNDILMNKIMIDLGQKRANDFSIKNRLSKKNPDK